MSDKFTPSPPEDPTVRRLVGLRNEAEAAGFTLLAYLIDVAVVEAERIAEGPQQSRARTDRRKAGGTRLDPTERERGV